MSPNLGAQQVNDNENLAQFPCVRNCCLDDDDICLGCFRSFEEIKHWNEALEPERFAILKNAQQRKDTRHSKVKSLIQNH